MKKVFALFMVIALLAVTGSAFAVTGVTAKDVTVRVGESARSVAEPQEIRTDVLNYRWNSDLSWMTSDGAEATFAPGTDVAEGSSYTATVYVTDGRSDTAGHYSTANATISVTVLPPLFQTALAGNQTTSVPLTPGQSSTVEILATPTSNLNGRLSYRLVSASVPTWVSLSDNIVNFNPPVDASGSVSVTILVIETAGLYTNPNPVQLTITGTIDDGSGDGDREDITGGTDVIEVKQETQISEVVEKVETLSITILVGDTQIVVPITDAMIKNALNASTEESLIYQGVSSEAVSQIAEDTKTAVVGIASTIYQNPDGTTPPSANPSEYTVEPPVGDSVDEQNNFMARLLAEALLAANVNPESSDLVAVASFTVTYTASDNTSKVAAFPIVLDASTYNAGISGIDTQEQESKNTGDYGSASASDVRSAAVSATDTMVFLNSKGAQITRVPGLNNDGVVPGLVTAVMRLKPGVKHTPIITVNNNDLPAEVKATPTQTEVEVIRTVASTFTAQSNSFFSTMVSWDLISSTDLTNGYAYYRISDDAGGRVNHVTIGDDWARTDADNAAMTSNPSFDLTRVVRLPALIGTNETEDNVYIVKVNFQISDANRAKILASADNGAFVFFPNGPQKTSARSRVTKVVDGRLVTMLPEELQSSSVTEGYLSFIIPAGETLEKPMLAVRLRKTAEPGPEPEPDEFYITASDTAVTVTLNNTDVVTYTATNASGDVTYSISPSADWVALTTVNNEATVTILPTDSALIASSPNTFTVSAIDEAGNTDSESLSITVTRQSSVPGSSGGGGCSAGFSALALAVLGAFIARRKK